MRAELDTAKEGSRRFERRMDELDKQVFDLEKRLGEANSRVEAMKRDATDMAGFKGEAEALADDVRREREGRRQLREVCNLPCLSVYLTYMLLTRLFPGLSFRLSVSPSLPV